MKRMHEWIKEEVMKLTERAAFYFSELHNFGKTFPSCYARVGKTLYKRILKWLSFAVEVKRTKPKGPMRWKDWRKVLIKR